MYKYVVTGASGWLGLNLIDAIFNGIDGVSSIAELKNEERILVLLLPNERLNVNKEHMQRIDIVYGSLDDVDVLKDFCRKGKGATLIHTAGIIHPKKRVKELYDVNFIGTKKLLNCAKNNLIAKAVVVSSNSPLGCNPYREHRFTEESIYNPYMNYGRSKMLMELAVREIQDENFPCVLIRAPWFYGPHQPARQFEFFRMIKNGKVPLIGDGLNVRSMVFLQNLSQGILLAANQTAANNQIYWIADKYAYAMKEIIDTIEHVMQDGYGISCNGKRVRLPSFISEMAWLLDFIIQSLGFYNQKVHVLSEMNKNIACSITKAEVELGYKPQFSLLEGMKICLREYN